MTLHAVRFEIEPAPEHRGDVVLKTHTPREAILTATNLPAKEPHEGSVVSGVQLDIVLDATDLDDALEAAYDVAEDYVMEMSVLSASRCGVLSPCIVVDISPAASVHPFRQIVRIQGEPSRRFLTKPQVPDFRDALEKLSDRDRKSVRRAVHAYREAMSTDDPLVEFMTLWIGLEALNSTLGHARGKTRVKSLEGTRRFIESEVEDGARLYKLAYGLRNDFVHGSRDVEQMTTHATNLIEPMRLACRDAIAHTVRERWTGDRRPLKNWPDYVVLETVLKAPAGTPLGPEADLPHFHLGDRMVFDLKRTGDKVRFRNLIPVLEPRFAPGVENESRVRVWILGEQVELNDVEFRTKRREG